MKATAPTAFLAALMMGLGLMALYVTGCGGVSAGPGALGSDDVSAEQWGGARATVTGRVVDVATLNEPGGPVYVNRALVRLQPVLGGRAKSSRTSRWRNYYYRMRYVKAGDYYVFVSLPFGYDPPSDPDGDPSNGIATITVPAGGTMTLPDIAVNVPQDSPPPAPF